MALAGADEGPFRELSLDRARQAATDGGKRFALVDFYTVWCGPCKKLDETTWKDQEVRDWLSKEAVCLKVDAEKDEPLADKYRIDAYPTVLLFRPDGAAIDRLVGYRDAKTFLADSRESLAGNDTLARARKKLEGANANDPMLRMSYGDALAQKGRAEDALSEYLWCFDHGLEHGPGFRGVRLSFLLARIVQLGRTYQAALDELRKRSEFQAGWPQGIAPPGLPRIRTCPFRHTVLHIMNSLRDGSLSESALRLVPDAATVVGSCPRLWVSMHPPCFSPTVS